MRYLFFIMLVFNQATFVFAAENSSKFLVIIDRIEVTGNTALTSEQMASNLEIPIGQEIPAASSAELLSEAERKMRATGKFKPDFSLKLRRGERFPHYILEVKADYTEDWYKGFSAFIGLLQDVEQLADAKSEYKIGGLSLFTGTRNIFNSDWAFDAEMLNLFFDLEGKYNSTRYDGQSHFGVQLNGLSLSIARPSFFSHRMVWGGAFRFSHMNSLSKFSNDSNYTYGNDTYRFQSESDSHSKSYSLQVEGFSGIKYSGFSFVGVYGRTANRDYWSRSNSESKSYKNGVESTEGSVITISNNSSSNYSGTVSLDLEWTLKSKIGLVEPGGEYSVNWKREYEVSGPQSPRTLATATYTFMLLYDIAISPGGRYLWSFDGYSDTKLKRTSELNTKIEKFNHEGEVYYLSAARSGDFSCFLRSSSEERSPMETKIILGYKFASTSLVYDLSASYGQSRVDDGVWLDGLQDVYKRIGVR